MYATEVSSGENSYALNINKSDIENTTNISQVSTEILKEEHNIGELVKRCWPLVDNDDAIGLEHVLQGTPIDQIVNDEGFTLLHICAFKNKLRSFNQILLSANQIFSHKSKEDRKNILKEWANAKTSGDEFSALHYAAFRGNIDICKTLIELGADKNVKNSNGLSFLHIAA